MLFASIELSKYIGAEIHQREVNGELVDCISIPIQPNGLFLSPKRKVYAGYTINERRTNCYGQSHYISATIRDKKLHQKLEDLGFMQDLKFIGSAKTTTAWVKTHPGVKTSLEEAMDK